MKIEQGVFKVVFAPFQDELHLDINETDGWKYPHELYIVVSRTLNWYHFWNGHVVKSIWNDKNPIKFTRSAQISVTTGERWAFSSPGLLVLKCLSVSPTTWKKKRGLWVREWVVCVAQFVCRFLSTDCCLADRKRILYNGRIWPK